MASEEEREALTWTAEERKEKVHRVAMNAGLAAAFKTSLFSVPAVLLLSRYSPVFKKLNVSAKTALAISPPIFLFAFFSDHVAARLANPYGFEKYVNEQREHSELPTYQRVANYIYFNPFKSLVFMSMPVVTGIFLTRDAQNLKFSQRLMHTRVMGQFSVLAILAGTMMFHDWMEHRGPYTVEENKIQRQLTKAAEEAKQAATFSKVA